MPKNYIKAGSFIKAGGDIIVGGKKNNEKEKFWKQFWIHIILGGILVSVIGGLIIYFITN